MTFTVTLSCQPYKHTRASQITTFSNADTSLHAWCGSNISSKLTQHFAEILEAVLVSRASTFVLVSVLTSSCITLTETLVTVCTKVA